ncbi:g365 [Coccomyxa viridis]|uniref:G365 protein n=1 Tax=Coccomyxa viridis TaxID=1274662 RepID=A0ABP1FFI2_9CHLO
MTPDAFDVHSAVASLCRRHPALDTQLRPFREQDAARLLPALVGVLQGALLQPNMTLAVGSCFRPMLLPLVDSIVEQALGPQNEGRASHAAVSVALISLLELAPHLERSVELYLRSAEPAFPQLLAGLPSLQTMGQSPETISKAGASHQGSPACSSAHTIFAQLGDADKARLRGVVLTPEEEVGCAVRWRADRERYAVERASFWMSRASSAPAASSGAEAANAAPAQQLAEVPRGSGYVSLGGVPVPSRGAQRGQADARQFVRTPTVEQNLQACALVLCQRRPLLLEGPPGSGKTALMSELARTTGNMDYITVHIDDQMDAKSMLGAYVCTAVPGEFVWRPGPLMQAVSEGRWLLIEDINLAPPDVLASLVGLLERRQLYLPQRAQSIAAHPGFQLIASVTSSPGGGQAGAYGSAQGVRDLLGGLWSVVAVQAPTAEEQLAILGRAFPQLSALLPAGMAALSLVKAAAGQSWDTTEAPWDTSVRAAMTAAGLRTGDTALHIGRHFSLRDAMKWAQRMQRVHGSLLQRSHQAMDTDSPSTMDVTQMPLALREAAFFESADCYTAMIANREAHRRLLTAVAALWALPEDTLEQYLTLRKPALVQTDSDLHVGRANLSKSAPEGESRSRKPAKAALKQGKAFAATGHVMRSLEAVAVAASQLEPVLLVGETGTGKTTLVQHLAEQVGTKLVALNLSQQTDSADLLGGFQPVDPSHALLPLLEHFQELVRRTWVKGNNEDFLTRTLKYAQRQKWPSLLKAFHTAVAKVNALQREVAADDTDRAGKRRKGLTDALREEWARFHESVTAAERAARMAEGGFAFAFKEGALVKALRQGHWVLLDEINLAPSEALERLAGIMESESSSIALVERGDLEPIPRHPDFRIFAAMNPATDAGKKELPAALRNRFTEMYISEPTALADLRAVVAEYLAGAAPNPPLDAVVDFYIAAKHEADMTLVDGAGSKPAYNLRTLSRALQYARAALPQYGLQRALYDGCAMAFLTQLHPSSAPAMERLLQTHILSGTSLKAVLRPVAQPQGSAHVLFEHFWVETGAQPLPEPTDQPHFVMTASGPTSTGKTSLVTYLAEQTGHRCVRINNHEQTDLQEYLGSYIADENGRLVFREGALVTAVRQGHWVVLDELNLAPSEVLEALNRRAPVLDFHVLEDLRT